jgi:hypothetical protein
MESVTQPVAAADPMPPAPRPSLIQRAISIYVRPNAAWAGLETRAAWWFRCC